MSLFIAELHRSFLMIIRYPLNFFVQIVMVVSLFYLLLMGAKYFSPDNVPSDKLEALIVNYFFWTIAVSTIAAVPRSIEDDARAGTLEQVLQTVFPVSLLFFLRGLSHTIIELGISFLILTIIILSTGVIPKISKEMFIPIGSVVGCALGIGLIIGGLGLRVKRTSIILAAMQLPLLFLLMYPFEKSAVNYEAIWWSTLPFVADAMYSRELLSSGEAEHQLTVHAYTSSLFWLALGITCFIGFLRMTKKNAKTNGY